jgi:hypothetical protein
MRELAFKRLSIGIQARYVAVFGTGYMFSLLAILVIVLAVGVVPTIATLLFSKTSRDDRESRRELLAIAVEVEKATTSWRARHQTPDREL